MHKWNLQIKTETDFDPSEPESLKQHPDYAKMLEIIQKKPHELLTADLLHWNRISDNRRNYVRYLQKSPFATIWDYIEPPLDTYYWQWMPSENDEGLGRLSDLSVDSMIPLDYTKWHYDVSERNKIERYRKIFTDGFTMSTGNPTKTLSTYLDPLRVYRVSGQYIVIDGVKRLLAARMEKVKSLRAWVIDSTDGFLLNRHHYRREAEKAGLSVPEDNELGIDSPAPVPPLTYREFRKMSYPSVHHQLDVIMESLVTGNKSSLEKLQGEIRAIKARFPKL